MPFSPAYLHPNDFTTFPAVSLERSTIKSEPSTERALRMRDKSDDHISTTAVVPLFSTADHHLGTYILDRTPSPSPSTVTMSTDGRIPSPGPQLAPANRMSVSTLCSPPPYSPSPSSTLPPHIARGPYDTSSAAAITNSPPSVLSGLSSPPALTTNVGLPNTTRPSSPAITVLDPAGRSTSPHQPHRLQQSMTLASFVTAPPPPLTSARLHQQMQLHAGADSPHAEVGAAAGGKRKRTSPSTTNDSGEAAANAWQSEFDERTKTWKNATGFRRDLTADKLTQPDAPTRKKRQTSVYPSTGPRTVSVTKAAVQRNRRGSTTSTHSGSGDSISIANEQDHPYTDSGDDDDDELLEAAAGRPTAGLGLGVTFDSGTGATGLASSRKSAPAPKKRKQVAKALAAEHSPSPSSPGPSTLPIPNPNGLEGDDLARLEKKRRQNTQAARRSRIRKAEEVQKLQNLLSAHEQRLMELDREVGDVHRERDRIEKKMKDEVLFAGLLKGVVVEMLGERRGGEVISVAEARWKTVGKPGSPPASTVSPIDEKESGKMEEDGLEGS